jgi:outer membrane murein-binding lipoprotein Lpp
MSIENRESLALEHIRHIRGKVDQIADDIDDLKARISSLDTSMVVVKREVNLGDEVDARQQVSLDKIVKRLSELSNGWKWPNLGWLSQAISEDNGTAQAVGQQVPSGRLTNNKIPVTLAMPKMAVRG